MPVIAHLDLRLKVNYVAKSSRSTTGSIVDENVSGVFSTSEISFLMMFSGFEFTDLRVVIINRLRGSELHGNFCAELIALW